MLSSVFNFLRDKLFSKPVIGRKRRFEECDEFPPTKITKVESKFILNRENSAIGHSNAMNLKNDNQAHEDDGCLIVAEIQNKNWGALPTMARKSIRKNQYKTKTGNSNVIDVDSSEMENSSYDCSEKDVEIVGYVNNNNFKSSVQEDKSKPVSNRIFKSCRTISSSSNSALKDREQSFRSIVKKRANFLRESYRLAEKYQYSQLLQSLSFKTNTIFPSPAQKPGLSVVQKTSIPLIDLTKERSNVTVNRSREDIPWTSARSIKDGNSTDEILDCGKEEIPRVNSFQDYVKTDPATDEDIVEKILSRHTKASSEMKKQASLLTTELEILSESNKKAYSLVLEERLRNYMRITSPAVTEVELEIDKYVLPKLTMEQEGQINKALVPSPAGQILAEKFGIQIKRRDMQTLKGLNWLNDEVINFYMNLIMERGKAKDLPSVYAFNTFFYPKLISSGHSSLKRWTKKVDIFSYDMLLIPVHLGMHWCMSVVDFRSKEVRYYDSMGSSNNNCLRALLTYLEDESLDKRKLPYSTSDWKKKNVEDIPQQMNGSDCGVFSCMFAEHLSRDTPVLFSQDNMPYFRRKMVLEILEGKLLT